MKVHLHLDSPEGGCYHPRDLVTGRIEIKGASFDKEPKITASLKGQVSLILPPEPCGRNLGKMTQSLFRESQTITFRNFASKKDSKGEISYTCPVKMRFPAKVASDHSSSYQLPSSVKVTEPGLTIQAEYFITVQVEKYVLGLVPKTTRVRKELPFLSNASLEASRDVLSSLGSSVLKSASDETEMISVLDGAQDDLPPYSLPTLRGSSIQIQVLPHTPSILLRKQKTPIGIVVMTPPDLLSSGQTYIRSVRMDLRQQITANFGSATGNVDQILRGCHMEGCVKIDEEVFELDPGLWGSLYVNNARPSCDSDILSVKHSVEISIGISRGSSDKIRYTSTSLDVTVLEPPPAYKE